MILVGDVGETAGGVLASSAAESSLGYSNSVVAASLNCILN